MQLTDKEIRMVLERELEKKRRKKRTGNMIALITFLILVAALIALTAFSKQICSI